MPLAATAKESYTVTLSNRGGSSTVTIMIKVSLGNFGYFAPNANAMITRLNLNDFKTTEVLDLKTMDPANFPGTDLKDTGSYADGFEVEGQAYFVPSQTQDGNYTGLLARLNLAMFEESGVQMLDFQKVHARTWLAALHLVHFQAQAAPTSLTYSCAS